MRLGRAAYRPGDRTHIDLQDTRREARDGEERRRRGSGTLRGGRGLSTKTEVLLADEAPIFEMDELKPLIAEGQDKGVLTFEQISTALEEVEVS